MIIHSDKPTVALASRDDGKKILFLCARGLALSLYDEELDPLIKSLLNIQYELRLFDPKLKEDQVHHDQL